MNIQKRHQRPRTLRDVQRGGEAGGIIEREGPIHVSNVMLLDPKTNEPTRVGVNRQDGKRERVAKKSGEAID
jgi:large subunit ribosomal protein L24